MGSTALRLLGFLSLPRAFQLGIRKRSLNWLKNQIEIQVLIVCTFSKLSQKAPELKKAWGMWKWVDLSQDSVKVYHQDSTIAHPF